MKEFNFMVGRKVGKTQNLYKEYFHKEILKGLEELQSYINCNLERFLMYDDVVNLIDSILKVGE